MNLLKLSQIRWSLKSGAPCPSSTRCRATAAGSIALCSTAALILLLVGCTTRPLDPGIVGPFHEPSNFYRSDQAPAQGVRRIAMLPLTTSEDDLAARSGRENLQTVLYGELTRSRRFEIVLVTEEQIEQWTDKRRWQADEELPADLLVRIKESTACDAILFNQLTVYRAYPPLAVGWRLLLVSSEDGQVVWAFDEVFDAGDSRVWNSVRQYALENEKSNAELAKLLGTRHGSLFPTRVSGLEWVTSPRHFAKYTASAAVQTLVGK